MNSSFGNIDSSAKVCPLISASLTVPYSPTDKMQLATIVSIVINCILWSVGLSANVLVFITVLRKPQLRTVYNMSVLWLLGADLCMIVLAQTSNIVYLVNKFTSRDYSCSLFFVYNLFTWWCYGLSFSTLFVISIERYFAVFYPFKYEAAVTRTRISSVVVLSWTVWSAVVLILHLVPNISQTTRAIVNASFALPSTISTLFIYCKISREIRGNIVHAVSTAVSQGRTSSKTIGLIIGAQMACFAPVFCFNIARTFSLLAGDVLMHGISPFAESAAFTNALLDPVIYFWRNREAKRSIKEVIFKSFCSRCPVRSQNAQDTSVHTLEPGCLVSPL